MKKLILLSLVVSVFVSYKQDNKLIIPNKWTYDLDEMIKQTDKNLEKLETKAQIMEAYKNTYLNTYKGVSYDFDKSGKMTWDDHGTIRKGTWGLSDNDSTIVIKTDTIEVSLKMLKISPKQIILQDNVVNTSPQFELSKPILKAN